MSDHKSQNEESIGLGILGAASIARKQLRALVGKSTLIHVVAIGSRNISKAQAMIDDFKITDTATAYGSYEEVLADPRVEAVYIPLPTTLHVEWVCLAAAAKKHILLEKPIAVTALETDEIIAACTAHNVQFMDGTMWMHHPRAIKMQKVLHSGKLGPLRDVQAQFSFPASTDYQAKDIRFKKNGDPLGALGDLGWYCIRAILWAFDFEAPIEVAAHPGAVFNAEGVPTAIGGTLVFSGGRRGTFTCSFDRAKTQRLDIGGPGGSISLEDFTIPMDATEAKFKIFFDRWPEGDELAEVIVHNEKSQELLMWEAFAACVNRVKEGHGVDPKWPAVAALTQKVVSAVAVSAAEGCTIAHFSQSKF